MISFFRPSPILSPSFPGRARMKFIASALFMASCFIAAAMLPARTSAECVDYGSYLHWTGRVTTPGEAQGVATDGHYAYVADSFVGVQIIDVTASLGIVRTVATAGEPRGIAITASEAYVADSNGGLYVIDITDPLQAAVIGHMDTPGYTVGVVVRDTLAYIADGNALVIASIADPANPYTVGTVAARAFWVDVSGSYAFLASDMSGYQVIDVSDPANPQLVGQHATTQFVLGIQAVGDLLFLTDGDYGVRILNISDPLAPQEIGSVMVNGIAVDVVPVGNLAYLAARGTTPGLRVVDISDPHNPVLIGAYGTQMEGKRVAVFGDRVFLTDESFGLELFDAVNPISPSVLGTLDTPGEASDVALAGNIAYVADYTSGLQVVSLADPTNPELLGALDTPGDALGVAISGTVACIADGASGLRVVDITDPANPAQVGHVDLPGAALKVAISGALALVADNDAGLQVVDIGTPASPAILGAVNTPGSASAVAVIGHHAFVADGGLRVVDFADPSNPVVVRDLSLNGSIGDLDVSGDLIYLPTRHGLYVFDVSDPINPQNIGYVETPQEEGYVSVAGGTAYVMDLVSGIQAVDVSNPQSPSVVGGLWLPYWCVSVAATEDYVVVAHATHGIEVLPAHCVEPTPVDLLASTVSWDGTGVQLQWEIDPAAAVTGFHVYRTTYNGRETRLTSRLLTGGPRFTFSDLTAEPGTRYEYLLEAWSRSGEWERMGPLSITTPTPPALRLRAAPNPAVESTVFYYSLAQPGPVSIRIFDIQGRLVATLSSGQTASGVHQISWDMTTNGGVPVPSGIYFARLATPGGTQGMRLSVLR